MELEDTSRGLNRANAICARIRDRETGEISSRIDSGCYYYSLYQEDGTVYIIGTKSTPPLFSGEGYLIFESRDLVHWSERELISNPGWEFYNSSLTKGPDGYVLCMEAREPVEYVGKYAPTFFSPHPLI